MASPRAYIWVVVSAAGFLPMCVLAAGVQLSEVLFNPDGTDTGFEYITIQNSGSEDINLGGWNLYPDIAGYFTFPAFTLGAGKTVTVFLRKEGVIDVGSVYHTSAKQNMGNTSGSVALFTSSDHGASSMVDFIQWGAPEKNLESTAEKAGLWTGGQFIVVDSGVEGKVLHRKTVGVGASAWEYIAANSSQQSLSSEEQPSPPPAEAGSQGKVYSGPAFEPTIRAYAGKDIRAIAGATTRFEGNATGWEDDRLDGSHIRYTWNFGDGGRADGKKVAHTYRYPGVYTATLTVVSGEDSARDDAVVTVEKNPVFISEILPGDAGWVELSNPGSVSVDISGWSLDQKFVFPEGTFLASKSFAVFARDAVGFSMTSQNPRVSLFYPNGVQADDFSYTGMISSGKSISRSGAAYVLSEPSPGAKNDAGAPNTAVATRPPVIAQKTAEAPPLKVDTEERVAPEKIPSPPEKGGNPASAQLFQSNFWWLIGSLAGGLAAGVGLLFLRKTRASNNV